MNVQGARLVTRTLVGICAFLALCAVVLYAGYGRGYGWLHDEDSDSDRRLQVGTIDRKPVQLPPASAFAAIDARPLFNEDRKPTPIDDTAGELAEAPPVSPLNVTLTGVIVDKANDVHVAMVQDMTRNQSVALRVGMPLEGDQASWTLVEVKPRAAVFRSAANEVTEIELEALAAPPKPPSAVRPPSRPGAGRGAPPDASSEKTDANADLARRIEERRRQMREDAERQRNGGAAATSKK